MATTNPVPTNDNDEDNFYGASSQVSSNAVAHEFFFVLLQAAPIAHMLHLQTRSYAEHMALDEFYKELPGLVDELIENYQGKYGIVNNYPTQAKMPDAGNPIKLVTGLSVYIHSTRAHVGSDSELQNLIDEIQSLVNSTMYKLKFLS